MANFPTRGAGLTQGESPSLYGVDFEKNEKKASTEGGYQFRRRQFSRTPPRIISTGFLGLKHSDYVVLENFWLAHQTFTAFTYHDYHFGLTRQMRFDEFKPDPKTIGQTRIWDVKIKMSEI